MVALGELQLKCESCKANTIKKMNGEIKLSSEIEEGTAFLIAFDALKEVLKRVQRN